jgi:rare lipoprotein A
MNGANKKFLRVSLITGSLLLAGCSTPPVIEDNKDGLRHTPPAPLDLASIPDAIPQVEPFSRYGNPARYEVFGREYTTLKDHRGYREKGLASWYGSKFHGQRTSSGEPYDMFAMTAAHKTLPLPCYARVTNLKNGRSIVIKINDRGPFHADRLIDLSYTAAWKLGIIGEGTGLVEVKTIDPRDHEPTMIQVAKTTESHTPAAKPLPAPEALKPRLPEPKSVVEAVPAKSELSGLFLQVGAFGNADNAHRLKNRLETELKTGVLVEEHNNANTPVFRVKVGPIASVELCDQLTNRLSGMGISEARLVVR